MSPAEADASRPGRLARLADRLFGIDTRSLALFRIAAGLLIVVDMLLRLRTAEVLHSDAGMVPRALLRETVLWATVFDFHYLVGSPAAAWTLIGVTALLAGGFALGWRTRALTPLLWLALGAVQYRSPFSLVGGDHLLRILLFWAMFLPLGERLSLDARRARDGAAPRRVCSVASAAALLTVMAPYFFSAFHKSSPEWWSEGSAVRYVLLDPDWTGPLAPLLLRLGWAADLATPATLAFEFGAPLLMFVPLWTGPLRALLVPGFLGFQAGLGASIQLGLFPWANAVALLLFVPTWAWLRLRRASPAQARSAPRTPLRLAGETLAALALLLTLWVNVAALRSEPLLPEPISRLAWTLGLHHQWVLFPAPARENRRWQVIGSLERSGRITLATEPEGPGWAAVRAAQRVFRVRHHLRTADPQRLRPYLRWLCRSWNADAPAHRQLFGLRVVQQRTRLRLRGPHDPPRHREVLTLACGEADPEPRTGAGGTPSEP